MVSGYGGYPGMPARSQSPNARYISPTHQRPPPAPDTNRVYAAHTAGMVYNNPTPPRYPSPGPYPGPRAYASAPCPMMPHPQSQQQQTWRRHPPSETEKVVYRAMSPNSMMTMGATMAGSHSNSRNPSPHARQYVQVDVPNGYQNAYPTHQPAPHWNRCSVHNDFDCVWKYKFTFSPYLGNAASRDA